MRLKGKVCIVTGGGSGIGRATCLLFAKEGASVVVADKRAEAAEAVAAEGAAGGATMLPTMMDVSRDDDAQRVVHQTVDAFGRLDVLVNNAGYGFAGTVVDTDEGAWDDLMAVNVRGVYLCSKHAIPAMAKNGGGAIVNTASVVAAVGIRNRAAYCASKGAVAALTRAIAIDHVAEGIRCNAVAPGTIDTPYFRSGRHPQPRRLLRLEGRRRGAHPRHRHRPRRRRHPLQRRRARDDRHALFPIWSASATAPPTAPRRAPSRRSPAPSPSTTSPKASAATPSRPGRSTRPISDLVGIRNRAAYCASKGAVAALTRAIAIDHVAEGIRCNAVAPGTIDTPYFRSGRHPQPRRLLRLEGRRRGAHPRHRHRPRRRRHPLQRRRARDDRHALF